MQINFVLVKTLLPPRQIKSTVRLCRRIKNRRRQIQTFGFLSFWNKKSLFFLFSDKLASEARAKHGKYGKLFHQSDGVGLSRVKLS